MVLASDFCVFYYNENYLPDMRKASKKALTSYLPKSGTQLAFDFEKTQGKYRLSQRNRPFFQQGDSLTKAFLLFYYTIDSQKPVSNGVEYRKYLFLNLLCLL